MKTKEEIDICIAEIVNTLINRIINKGYIPKDYSNYRIAFKSAIDHIKTIYNDEQYIIKDNNYYSVLKSKSSSNNYGEIHIFYILLFMVYNIKNISTEKRINYLMEVISPILYKHGIKSVSVGSDQLRILNSKTKQYEISKIKVIG